MDTDFDSSDVSKLDYAKWHQYGRSARHSLWKFLLPASKESPVLGIGLEGRDLASLGRSWTLIDVLDSKDAALSWAVEQAKSLGQTYKFRILERFNPQGKYPAIAVNVKEGLSGGAGPFYDVLEPGGMVIFLGQQRHLPTRHELVKLGFRAMREYMFLPFENPTILVPLLSRRSIKASVSFMNPEDLLKRLALRFFPLAPAARILGTLGSQFLMVAQRPGRLPEGSYLFDWISEKIGETVVDATVYGGWTKQVFQLFGSKSQILGYAKTSDVVPGEQSLQRENKILKALTGHRELTPFLSPNVFMDHWQRHTVQIMQGSASSPQKRGWHLTPAHYDFLNRMGEIDVREMPLEQWPVWTVLWNWAHEGEFASQDDRQTAQRIIKSCAQNLSNGKIPFHRVHGDFSPWNTLLHRGRLTVIDWEDSTCCGLPLYDFVYFHIKPLICKRGPAQSIARLIKYCDGINLEPARLDILKRLGPIAADVVKLNVLLIFMMSENLQLKDQIYGMLEASGVPGC